MRVPEPFRGPVGEILGWYFNRQLNRGLDFDAAVERTASVFSGVIAYGLAALLFCGIVALGWLISGPQGAIGILAGATIAAVLRLTRKKIA